MKTIALHGFLGLPADWSKLKLPACSTVEAVDLWRFASGAPESAYAEWAKAFTRELRGSIDDTVQIIGYSLGGRLAMHAICEAPDLFSKAVIVSAHPGLRHESERRDRLLNDRAWAARFRVDPWEDLLRAWNSQPVFRLPESREKDWIQLDRPESLFSREKLSFALDAWSLGRQSDLRERIIAAPVPLKLISGAADSKFTALLSEFAASQKSRRHPIEHFVVQGAGHRVPWDAPELFTKAIAWPVG